MNRLTEIAYFDSQYANFTYTASGQRDMASTRTHGPAIPQVYDYSYDPFQRLKQVAYPDGRAVSYTYTDNNLRETMTTPAGTTTYGYDALSRLTSVSAGGSQTTYEYDPVGFLTDIHRPNGVDTTYTPNIRNQLERITHSNALGTLLSFTYELDNAGNREKVTESGSGTTTWTYDKLYRLTDEEARPGTTTHFEYDAAGNRDWMTVNGVVTDYEYNALDQLVSTSNPSGTVTYTYDGRGNLDQVTAGSQTTDYTYNAADRLTMVNGLSSVVQYGYDADGRRIKQTVGSQVTNYLWDEASAYGDVVLETDGSGSTLASYVLGEMGIVSQSRSGTTNYYLQDGQGSTRALANAAGNVTDTYSYTAFGELSSQTGSTANSYLYTGQQFDALTGLYDLRARYYDPALGRFLSQDTYSYNFSNPIELNRYVYAANDPVNRMDPTGYFFVEYALKGALIGGIVLGSVNLAYQFITKGYNNINWWEVLGYTIAGAFIGATIAVGSGYVLACLRNPICAGKVFAAWSVLDWIDDTATQISAVSGDPEAQQQVVIMQQMGSLTSPLEGPFDFVISKLRKFNVFDGFTLDETLFIKNVYEDPKGTAACHFAALCGVTTGNPMYPDDTGRLMANPEFELVGDLKSDLSLDDLRPGDLITYYDNAGRVVHSDRVILIDNQ